jgi:hypothetical protein
MLWAATWAAHRGENQSQAGLAWLPSRFWPMANRKMRERLFIFQIFSKFQTNLNLNQIYNFDDFHSHNKI